MLHVSKDSTSTEYLIVPQSDFVRESSNMVNSFFV